jgi:hypothetical protein
VENLVGKTPPGVWKIPEPNDLLHFEHFFVQFAEVIETQRVEKFFPGGRSDFVRITSPVEAEMSSAGGTYPGERLQKDLRLDQAFPGSPVLDHR